MHIASEQNAYLKVPDRWLLFRPPIISDSICMQGGKCEAREVSLVTLGRFGVEHTILLRKRALARFRHLDCQVVAYGTKAKRRLVSQLKWLQITLIGGFLNFSGFSVNKINHFVLANNYINEFPSWWIIFNYCIKSSQHSFTHPNNNRQVVSGVNEMHKCSQSYYSSCVITAAATFPRSFCFFIQLMIRELCKPFKLIIITIRRSLVASKTRQSTSKEH